MNTCQNGTIEPYLKLSNSSSYLFFSPNKPGGELGSFPAGSTFRFRINDADEALGDNGGSLKVCLVYGVG